MKKNSTYTGLKGALLVLALLVGMTGCKIDEEVFPNDPTLEDITSDATLGELNNLVSGGA